MATQYRFQLPTLNNNMRTIAYADTLESKVERMVQVIRSNMNLKNVKHTVNIFLDGMDYIVIGLEAVEFFNRKGTVRINLSAYQLTGYLMSNPRAMARLEYLYNNASTYFYTPVQDAEITVAPKRNIAASLIAAIIK